MKKRVEIMKRKTKVEKRLFRRDKRKE